MLSRTDASRKSGRTFWPEKISNKESHRMTKVTTRGNVFSEWTRIESQRSHWHGESRGNKSRSIQRGNLATNLDSWAKGDEPHQGRRTACSPRQTLRSLLSAGHKRIKIRCQTQHVTSLANKYLQLTELTSPNDKCKRNLPSESFLRYLSKTPLDATSNIVDRNTLCFDWQQNKQYKRNSRAWHPLLSHIKCLFCHLTSSTKLGTNLQHQVDDFWWWFLSFSFYILSFKSHLFYVESEHLPLNLLIVLFALSSACYFKLSLI